MRSIEVTSVSTTIIDVPSVRPHRFAGHEIKHQSYLLVEIETAEGIAGIGEGVSPGGPWWSGEAIESQKAMIDHHLAPALVAMGPTPAAAVVDRLDAVARNNHFAKAAIEMALFDAVGKFHDVPVATLLGGGPVRSSIPVRWALGASETEVVVEEGIDRLATGHSGLKLKMGALEAKADIERVGAIVDRIGPDVDYLVDPNGAWDLRTATWALDALEEIGIGTVEQPIDRDDVEGMAHLRRRATTISIMADESICVPADVLRMAERRACDSVAVKVPKAGGFLRGYAVGVMAATAGMRCYGGSALETSIGTAASAQLFAALPELSLDCELVGPLLLIDDITVDPIEYVDGVLQVPVGAGLGVEVDRAKVRQYQRP